MRSSGKKLQGIKYKDKEGGWLGETIFNVLSYLRPKFGSLGRKKLLWGRLHFGDESSTVKLQSHELSELSDTDEELKSIRRALH